MKKVLLILSILVFAVSCQDKTTTYTLMGKTDSVPDGTKVYLSDDFFRKEIVDSTTIKDNEFVFEGKLEKPVMLNLKVEGVGLKQEDVAKGVDVDDILQISSLIVLEPEKTIKVIVNSEGRIKQNGSSLAKKHREFWSNMGIIGTPDSESVLNMVKENKDNAIGMFYFANMIEFFHPNSKTLKEFYTLFSDKHGEDKGVNEMLNYIKNLDNIAAVGSKYTDIKAKTPDGLPIALSDYVGKNNIVLLHFQAWLKNTEKDIPYLADAYAKYKDKGLEIVDVSLDIHTKEWKESIDKHNIRWPQMGDTKQINPIIKTYALFDTPFIILIDKNGTIIDRQIPVAELDAKLNELLK